MTPAKPSHQKSIVPASLAKTSAIGRAPALAGARPASSRLLVITPESDFANLPTVAVHVTSSVPSLQPAVRALGKALYDRLTRPVDDDQVDDPNIAFRDGHMGAGAGLPVFAGVAPDKLRLADAQSHVILVLGDIDPDASKKWAAHVSAPTVVSLPADENTPVENLITLALHGVASGLRPTGDLPALYISCAKSSAAASQIVRAIQAAATPAFRRAYVNAMNIGQHHAQDGVFMVIHDDDYSDDQTCLIDLLAAKECGLPLIEVMALERGTARSSRALGNLPAVVWSGDSQQACVERALCEWIKACVFLDQAEAVRKLARLPDCVALSRPPETVDVSTRRVDHAAGDLIFHPDPELAIRERRLLMSVNPRLQFLTPTTAYRFLQHDNQAQSNAANFSRSRRTPLDGQRVGLSLSNASDDALAAGTSRHHVHDAIAFVARSIISAGGGIAYGGDSRRNGFKLLLADLVRSYSLRAPTRPELLHSYQDVFLEPDSPAGTVCHSMREQEEDRPIALITAKDAGEGDEARSYASCDTRRVMTDSLTASVLIGGKGRPKRAGTRGYSGLFPGLLEEAWRMMKDRKPVYVVGGFGGMTQCVAQVMDQQPMPEALRESFWLDEAREHGDTEFARKRERLRDNPWREQLGLPDSMDTMAAELLAHASQVLASDESALAWNGLTVVENRQLFSSTNPIVIAGLILKGLTTLETRAADQKLRVELINGDILAAERLDVLSVSAVRGLPMTGAALRVDERVNGRLALAVQSGVTLLGVHDNDVPTDWLHVVTLDLLSQQNDALLQLEQGVKDLVDQSRRSGFERIGVVLFGGTLLEEVSGAIDELIKQLASMASDATVFWFEKDPDRFELIQNRIVEHHSKNVDLSVMLGEPVLESEAAHNVAVLVNYRSSEGDEGVLSTYVLPSHGTALAPVTRTPLSKKQLSDLSKGIAKGYIKKTNKPDTRPRYYPVDDIVSRGQDIARHLFGDAGVSVMCAKLRDKTVQIAHDRAAANIPFELMRPPDGEPVIQSSPFNRRLTVAHGTADTLFAAPLRKRKPTALLVADPTKDLPGARAEGEAVFRLLDQMSDLKELRREDAKRDAVLELLPDADFFHYCGHGFFTDEKLRHCGLALHDYDLTLEHLTKLPKVPRIVVMNACEVGRLVDHDLRLMEKNKENEPGALAEFFLHSGAQVFVGAHWALEDRSGKQFSEIFYAKLFQGHTVSDAVHFGRQALMKTRNGEWGNYVLYGQGDIRLCHPE